MKIGWFVVLLWPVHVFTQDTTTVETDPDAVEQTLLEGYAETDGNAAPFSEAIEYLRQNPLDLNTAAPGELAQLPGLSPILVDAIVRYRRSQFFKTERQLLQVPGMTREVFVAVKDYVVVREATAVKRYEASWRQRTERNVERTENFREGDYEGNVYQIYNRFDARYRPLWTDFPSAEIQAGLVIEKDPGETAWNDHQAAYVAVTNAPFIKKAVFGNFQLEFGQGIALWGASGLSKSTETVQSVKRRGRGLTPYRYATENSAFQGAAVEWDLSEFGPLKPFSLTTFYSYARYDASKNPDGTVNSILTDGLHRNENETERRDVLLETMGGFNLDYRFSASSAIGATYYAHQFNRRFINDDPVRQRFEFTGHENAVASLHYDWVYDDVNFFGEAARDREGAYALNSGLQIRWPRVEAILFYRRYDRDFQSLRGYAFGEQSGRTQNEEGIYTGVQWRPRRRTTIQFYYDHFRYPWRTYDVPQPVQGRDFLVSAEQGVWRSGSVLVLYKNESKDVAADALDALGRDITIVQPAVTQRLRLQYDHTVVPAIRLRSRMERSWYDVTGVAGRREHGVLFYEDVRWAPRKDWTIYARLSFFDIVGSNAALYEYENDVEGVFSNTRFSGRGSRWYIFMKYRVHRQADLGVKFWQMVREDVSQIGSGGDAIRGNVLNRVTVSLDVSL